MQRGNKHPVDCDAQLASPGENKYNCNNSAGYTSTFVITYNKQDAQLSQRPRCRVRYSFRQK